MRHILPTGGLAVKMRLDFIKPFEAHNQAEFRLTLQPDGSTKMSWAMQGPNTFMAKVMGMRIDMDKMVGKDFEDGLRNLQQLTPPSTNP